MKHKIYLFITLLFFACSDDEHIFPNSPAERMKNHIEALNNELTDAPYGWKMVYFSRTDSLLFTSPNKAINRMQSHFRKRLEKEGFGGHYFIVKFSKGGKLSMTADFDENSISNAKESTYQIEQSTYLQLSFTTYNYLHKLINETFKGSSDFLYVGKDTLQNLVFKTANYIESAREYIVLEKLKSESDDTVYMQNAYDNRKFFENMKNPQLLIQQGSREFFRSDVYIKRNEHNVNEKFLKAIVNNRYYVFESDANPLEQLGKRMKSYYLGSGYVGTENGLTFRAGLRYNKQIIFYDFVRVGDRFVSKYYDPNGIIKGYVAEIWDEKVKE